MQWMFGQCGACTTTTLMDLSLARCGEVARKVLKGGRGAHSLVHKGGRENAIKASASTFGCSFANSS